MKVACHCWRIDARWLASATLVALALLGATACQAAEDPSYAALVERVNLRDKRVRPETKAALDAARAAHDERAELLALRNRSLVLEQLGGPPAGSPDSLQALNRRGVELARKLGDDESLGRFLYLQAITAVDDGAPAADVVPMFDQSIAIGQREHLDRLLADDYRARGELAEQEAQGATALDFLNRALPLFEARNVRIEISRVLADIAEVYRLSPDASTADLETSASLLTQAIAGYDPRHDQENVSHMLMDLGMTQQRLNQTAAAEADWRRALAIGDSTGSAVLQGEGHFRLGKSLVDRGLTAEGIVQLDAARVIWQALRFVHPNHAITLFALARAHARLHQRDAALALLSEAREKVQALKIPRLDVDYHEAAADVQASLGDYPREIDELKRQLVSEREAARVNDDARLQEMKVRFDVDLKDRDNALLKARAAEADSRRLALLLALVSSVLILGGGALLLILRLRSQRASAALLARLARNGREMTIGLDQSTVIATLRRQLGEMSRASSSIVWLRGAGGLERAGAADSNPQSAGMAVDPPGIDRLVARCASLGQELLHVVASPPSPRRGIAGLRRRAMGMMWVFEPLLDGDQVIGIVQLRFEDARSYRGRERQIVLNTCQYAAVALANVRTAQLLGESQVELEQERTRDMLVHTARLVTVGSMASGIVHEMSHPVGAMMLQSGNAQASLEVGDAGDASEALNGIRREARRLQNLISRLRNLCRADPPLIERIDLLAVLEDAHVLFQPQLHMARVEFSQDAASLMVEVDAERVVLAIANIVFNAMDAMEGRDVRRIEIGAAVQGDDACVSIRDTGPGLTPVQLARLFEPFYTTKPPGKGLGLGLALSVKSIASMNGRIEAANHPDGGAVFRIFLPLAATSGARSDLPAAELDALR